MRLIASRKHTAAAVDIDAFLQDSYLLVVELKQGKQAQQSQELRELCAGQIERTRQELEERGLSQRTIDHISHAQCALLDETVLRHAVGDIHAGWASEPLQARFFGRHQAGESLYEEMREVLREPAPDRLVLTVFQRVLMLGFQGRYDTDDAPEREQLLTALNEQVAPLELSRGFSTRVTFNGWMNSLYGLGAPLAHGLAVGLLLVGAWWGMDHLLGGVIASLATSQV